MDELDKIQSDILAEYIQNVIDAIKLAQDNAIPYQLKASGNLQESMKVVKGQHSDRAFLSADNYLSTTFQGVGVKKNKIFPLRQITQWLTYKPIVPRDEQGRFLPRKSLAYLIARKIWLEGSAVARGDRQGVPINKILKAELPPTGRKLAQAYARDFANKTKKELE